MTVKKVDDEIALSSSINHFLSACHADGLSERTIQDYHDKLSKFEWWDSYHSDLGTDPNAVTVLQARDFAAYLREPNSERWGITRNRNNKAVLKLSAASIAAYGRAVKVFFNWLEREKYIDQSPFNRSVKFTNRHKHDRTIKSVSESDLETIFTTLIEKRTTYTGCRNLAIIALLLDSGIRRGELLSLNLNSVDITRKRIKVSGKSGDRTAFFSELAANLLTEYLNNFRLIQDNSPQSALWLTARGEKLSYDGFSVLVRRINASSGVEFHAHQLRHTFASMLAANGMNVFTLKEMLGHSNITTTQIYISQNADKLQRSHAANSPLTNLGIRGLKRRGKPPASPPPKRNNTAS
jgi:site-specific recombinase XerD